MSDLFLSNGSDPFAHLRSKMTDIPAAAFKGLWATVDLQPNMFSPQRFAIGVLVGHPSGAFFYRMLSDLSKFECVYGRKASSWIRPLYDSAEYAVARAQKEKLTIDAIQFESPSISISKPWPTSGKSAEQVLSRLFAEVVAMEPTDEKQSRDFVTLDNEQVRHLVNEEIKRIAGLRYEHIVVAPNHVVPADDASDAHVLDFNLRTTRGAGSVLSAVYKTPSTVELNLLRASRDLSTYRKIRSVDDLALFIMSGKKEQFESAEYARLNDLLDEQSWCLEKQGFKVVTFDEPLPIAKSIVEWAEAA